MQWSGDKFEQIVKSYSFFQNHGYNFVGREVSKPGTWLERHIVRLNNPTSDRSIKVTFFTPPATDKPAVSNVIIGKTSTDEWFHLMHYIKQHHGIEVDEDGFRYTSYSGTFEERVRAFLKFATDLLEKYALPTLQGKEWPDVDFDWSGDR